MARATSRKCSRGQIRDLISHSAQEPTHHSIRIQWIHPISAPWQLPQIALQISFHVAWRIRPRRFSQLAPRVPLCAFIAFHSLLRHSSATGDEPYRGDPSDRSIPFFLSERTPWRTPRRDRRYAPSVLWPFYPVPCPLGMSRAKAHPLTIRPPGRQLLAIQKKKGNDACCDCGSPSPQWASPKFGIFLCLNCAGLHRGLGVHISFVRSVTMDAFKPAEIERMRFGGNSGWKKFWADNANEEEREVPWEAEAVPTRYPGYLGEQYKENLTCRVEGREFVMGERKDVERKAPKPSVESAEGSRSGTPLSGRRDSQKGEQGGRVRVDDKYFARLGADNATRRDDVPPSQGGKYAGFGSTPAPAAGGGGDGGVPFDEWQKDSVAAITKGFGWFTSTVTRTAKTVNDGYIQPTASKVRILLSSPSSPLLHISTIPYPNSHVLFRREADNPPSSPSPTSASKPNSPPRPSPDRPRRAPATQTRTSCASSRATPARAGTAPRRWTSRARTSGTSLRISGSKGLPLRVGGAGARLGRRLWGRGGRRRMSGIGEL